jgi:hypothetical protein
MDLGELSSRLRTKSVRSCALGGLLAPAHYLHHDAEQGTMSQQAAAGKNSLKLLYNVYVYKFVWRYDVMPWDFTPPSDISPLAERPSRIFAKLNCCLWPVIRLEDADAMTLGKLPQRRIIQGRMSLSFRVELDLLRSNGTNIAEGTTRERYVILFHTLAKFADTAEEKLPINMERPQDRKQKIKLRYRPKIVWYKRR